MQSGAPIPIVGAGIAGLTSALSLAACGFDVEIFERAEQLSAAGAGIQLSPNAMRVLDRLGLAEALAERGTRADHVTLRSARSGRVLARVPVMAADGAGYLALHRSDLQQTLLAAVESHPAIRLHLGIRLERVVLRPAMAELQMVAVQNGAPLVREGPVAIAADGVRSAAALSLGLPEPRPSGAVARRISLPASALADAPVAGIEAWLGPRRHAVAYPVTGGEAINLVLIVPEADAEGVEARFASWDPRLRAMIHKGVSQGVWPLLTTDEDRQPVHGRALALVGDSAHAMLPYAAQGAALAIEDGYVLATALAGSAAAADGLERFAASRRDRVAKVRARVRFHELVYHLPMPFALGRDLALAWRSPQSLRDDLAWLYDWTPPLA